MPGSSLGKLYLTTAQTFALAQNPSRSTCPEKRAGSRPKVLTREWHIRLCSPTRIWSRFTAELFHNIIRTDRFGVMQRSKAAARVRTVTVPAGRPMSGVNCTLVPLASGSGRWLPPLRVCGSYRPSVRTPSIAGGLAGWQAGRWGVGGRDWEVALWVVGKRTKLSYRLDLTDPSSNGPFSTTNCIQYWIWSCQVPSSPPPLPSSLVLW